MADYWVSQNRKYCEFCKCWITDNKPSIDFHEKGRRHQENVKKRLKNISRHSTQVQKNSDRTDLALRQMEAAALEAYQKDIEENDGDLTSRMMHHQTSRFTKLWNEAKTREGKSYYVNVMTKEIVWTPPAEGYLSIKEQKEQRDMETKKQLKALEKFKKQEAMMTMQKIQQDEAEEAARQAREKLKERRVVDDTKPETLGPLLEPGKTEPYGRWQTVKQTEIVDLQLPTVENYQECVVEYEPEPIVKEFKEKTVDNLGSGEASFKKRKLNTIVKRNIRQRLDDD